MVMVVKKKTINGIVSSTRIEDRAIGNPIYSRYVVGYIQSNSKGVTNTVIILKIWNL